MSAQHPDCAKVILTALIYLDLTTAHATRVTRQTQEIQVGVDLRIPVKVSFLLFIPTNLWIFFRIFYISNMTSDLVCIMPAEAITFLLLVCLTKFCAS